MAISSSQTIYFRNVFESWQDVVDFINDQNILVPTYTFNGQDMVEMTVKILWREFKNSSICYFTKDDFLTDFANTYEDSLAWFSRKLEICEKMYALTEDELQSMSEHGINTALNNNAEMDTNEFATFVSNQVHEFGLSNKLESFIRAYQNVMQLGIKEFINNFKELFIPIFTPIQNVYITEDE